MVAHVFGHTDFFKHNLWFEPTNRQMVETVSQNAQRIRQYSIDEGNLEVEKFLDAVLSIADHIDPYPRREAPEGSSVSVARSVPDDGYGDLFPTTGAASSLSTGKPVKPDRKGHGAARRKVPPEPEKDLLRFLLEHAEGLEDWQRDVIAIVREESLDAVSNRDTARRAIGIAPVIEVNERMNALEIRVVGSPEAQAAIRRQILRWLAVTVLPRAIGDAGKKGETP